ncbi:hypothetical protein [uncultured Amphritea sp.]|uniref:DUF4376 domain-containing protein n=1 Tax=uncultured Amphritea sp. TaxID=981605 RepID=UPI002625B3C2|nr:hypothetical protein [uncultured Amphritea sp.]
MNIIFFCNTGGQTIDFIDRLVTSYLDTGTVGFFPGAVSTTVINSDLLVDAVGDVNIYDGSIRHNGVVFDEAILISPAGSKLQVPDWVGPTTSLTEYMLPPEATSPTVRKKAVRDAGISSGFAWGGSTFQTRPQDLTLISGRATKILALKYFNELHPDFYWMTEANTPHLFTPDEFMRFAIAVDEFVEQKFIESWQ